jgi:hypothetical protein
VHDASLTWNLAALGRIGNWLSTVVHVAQTARREVHSGLISSLKETHQADPERRKEYKSPTPWRSETEEDASEQGSGHQGHDAQSLALLLAARTNVRDVLDGVCPIVAHVNGLALTRALTRGGAAHDSIESGERPAPRTTCSAKNSALVRKRGFEPRPDCSD